ncbi:hypothetical protein P9112_004696 [Eukaryota sp. TZLM1-RC]
MIIQTHEFSRVYVDIKAQSHPDKLSTIVFVGPGVDSLCSFYILTHTLHSDHLHYTAVFVSTVSELCLAYQHHVADSMDVTTVFLINCGADLRLRSLFKPHPRVKFFIFDSQRPVSLINAHESRQIIIVDDFANTAINLIRKAQDQDEDEEVVNSDSETEESYQVEADDFNFNNDIEGSLSQSSQAEPPYKKVRTEDGDEEMLEIGILSHKRLGISKGMADQYRKFPCSFGDPSSLLIYDQLLSIDRENLTRLAWAACVGCAEYEVLNRCSYSHWEEIAKALNDIVKSLKQNVVSVEDGTINPEPLIQLTRDSDFCFNLYRFCSLQTSIENTPTFSAKFALHKDSGRTFFARVLARIGVSVRDSKLLFQHMSNLSKDNLENCWQDSQNLFNLPDFKTSSFFIKRPGRIGISAKDVASVLAFVLMSPEPRNIKYNSTISELIKSLSYSKSVPSTALELLTVPNEKRFTAFVDCVCALNSLVSKTARTILAEKMLRHNNLFYDVKLNNAPPELSSHYAASLLAHFLQVSITQLSKHSKYHHDLPLILSIYSPEVDPSHHLVVGKVNLSLSKNYIGQCFAEFAADPNMVDRFALNLEFMDSTIIKVAKDQIEVFIDSLMTWLENDDNYDILSDDLFSSEEDPVEVDGGNENDQL